MLNIGNKVFRTLQEQVGYNSEQIEKIFEVLDGLNIQDNVVVVSDISDILDSDELAIVQKEVAFIIYNDHLYIKRSEDSSSAYFDVVFSITASTVITFNQTEIAVTLSNGALALTTTTAYTYSQSQMDSLLSAKASINYVDTQLALKADLAGATFTGAITAPSITESMSGYSFDSSVKNITNVTTTFNFAGVVKNGNKLTLGIALEFTRTGDTSGNVLCDIVVPTSIYNKLYSNSLGYLENKEVYMGYSYSQGATVNIALNKVSPNKIRFYVYKLSYLTENTLCAGRIEVTFLLSDNLAS